MKLFSFVGLRKDALPTCCQAIGSSLANALDHGPTQLRKAIDLYRQSSICRQRRVLQRLGDLRDAADENERRWCRKPSRFCGDAGTREERVMALRRAQKMLSLAIRCCKSGDLIDTPTPRHSQCAMTGTSVVTRPLFPPITLFDSLIALPSSRYSTRRLRPRHGHDHDFSSTLSPPVTPRDHAVPSLRHQLHSSYDASVLDQAASNASFIDRRDQHGLATGHVEAQNSATKHYETSVTYSRPPFQ
ncbi:hypothetical protein MRB53_040244 [Persea americana]|nr:hypothetical protein MRB53_040244 [Persea americana]